MPNSEGFTANQDLFLAATAKTFKRLRGKFCRVARASLRFDSCFDDADRNCKKQTTSNRLFPQRQIEAQTPYRAKFPISTRYIIDAQCKTLFCRKLPILD